MGDDSLKPIDVKLSGIGKNPGSFIFLLPDQKEFLRVEPDGRCFVRGHFIEENEEVWRAFKQWLARAGVNNTVDAIDIAWGIIANAHGGNWDQASDEWRAAAARWRDEYITGREHRDGTAVSIRSMSDAQILQALKNAGCYVSDCDACAASFFTGSIMNEKHTCPKGR